jgi:hypothetical protein
VEQDILEAFTARKYAPTAIRCVASVVFVDLDSGDGVTRETLLKRFADCSDWFTVVGFGYDPGSGRYTVMVKVRGVSDST